jgi:hypothetical protein
VASAVGSHPTAVAVGDLNGDGNADLAAADSGANAVSVLLGNGDGTFGPHVDTPTGSDPPGVTVGDVTGDGTPDLVVPNYGAGTVSVLPGNGDGTFGTRTDLTVGSGPDQARIGDFNGDGLEDIAVANVGSGSISVLTGGASGFQAATFPVGSQPRGLAVADFDGDGRPDLAVADSADNAAAVLANTTAAGEDASVSAQVLPTLTVSVDKTALSFGALRAGASATRTLTATVASNDSAGYQLAVSRTTFTPKDLPLSLACSACGLPGTPVPVGTMLGVAQATTTSAAGGDSWATTLALGPIPDTVPSGSYSSTLTFTVVGL